MYTHLVCQLTEKMSYAGKVELVSRLNLTYVKSQGVGESPWICSWEEKRLEC